MARKNVLSKPRANEVPHAAGQGPTETAGAHEPEPSGAAVPVPPGTSTEPAGAEASAAIAEALSEAGEAAQRAIEALAAEGVPLAAGGAEGHPAPASERRRKTKAQLLRAAQRERDFGRKLLVRRTAGFASLLREVRINNGVLAAAFERFFPVIERCAYLLARHGGAVVGDASAEELLARMRAMTEEIHADRVKELETAQAYIGEQSVRMGERFVTPEFTAPAFTGTVQLRTPQAGRVLEFFLVSDQVLTEFETLYWNQLRSISDRNEQMLRSKKIVRPLFAFAAATTRNLYRRMKDQVEATLPQAGLEPGPALAREGAEPSQQHPEAALAA